MLRARPGTSFALVDVSKSDDSPAEMASAGAGAIDLDFGALCDSLPVGVLVVNATGLVVYANPHADGMFQYTGGVSGLSVEDLMPFEHRDAHRELRRAYQEHPVVRAMGEGRLLQGRCSDGSTFLVEIALSPHGPPADRLTAAIVRDITSRVETEESTRHSVASTAVADDRMRIARDLHDHVIQELFAAGLTLSSVSSVLPDFESGRLDHVVSVLDNSIRSLRAAIFQLQAREANGDLGPIVAEASHVLGFRPQLIVRGDLTALDSVLRTDVMAVVRETLSNVARHANATSATVSVDVGPDEVIVEVVDDGVGLVGAHLGRGTGLRSLEERAVQHGGRARFEPAPNGGTLVTWSAPHDGGPPP